MRKSKSATARRLAVKNGNGADVIDIESLPALLRSGAGSSTCRLAVENRAKQLEVRRR